MPTRASRLLGDSLPRVASGFAAFLWLGVVTGGLAAQQAERPAGPDTARARDAADPVARLQARMERGEVVLSFDSVQGWLPSLLEHLDVPVSSQGLVFSRTSLQTDRIAPWAPRALYFNDDVYVGYVQDGGVLELAAVRPDGGTAFYTLSQVSPGAEARAPRFRTETTTCLMCHESRSLTGGVPGLIIRSVLTDRLGYPVTEVHEGLTTERTALEQRWGGWYVTGTAGSLAHAGNAASPSLRHEIADVDRYIREFDFDEHRQTPSERFDASVYPSPHSDAVALSVLLHQVRVHNLISGAHESARQAVREMGRLETVGVHAMAWDSLHPAGRVRIEGAAQRLVDAMLFVREAPLPAGLEGSSGFAEEFQARGPRDDQGRSLRELDLEDRLFRYPLSFLVHSDAFRALPALVKDRVVARLVILLESGSPEADFAHLTPDARRAVLEILRATEPELLPG